MTQAAGSAILDLENEIRENCRVIAENRRYLSDCLRSLGFTLTDSSANFVFTRHKTVPGETLYLELKKKGVLVRHFNDERIKDYNRITVGSREEINILLEKIREITEEAK